MSRTTATTPPASVPITYPTEQHPTGESSRYANHTKPRSSRSTNSESASPSKASSVRKRFIIEKASRRSGPAIMRQSTTREGPSGAPIAAAYKESHIMLFALLRTALCTGAALIIAAAPVVAADQSALPAGGKYKDCHGYLRHVSDINIRV